MVQQFYDLPFIDVYLVAVLCCSLKAYHLAVDLLFLSHILIVLCLFDLFKTWAFMVNKYQRGQHMSGSCDFNCKYFIF